MVVQETGQARIFQKSKEAEIMYYKYAVVNGDSAHLHKTRPSIQPMAEELYELEHIDQQKQFFVGGKVI